MNLSKIIHRTAHRCARFLVPIGGWTLEGDQSCAELSRRDVKDFGGTKSYKNRYISLFYRYLSRVHTPARAMCAYACEGVRGACERSLGKISNSRIATFATLRRVACSPTDRPHDYQPRPIATRGHTVAHGESARAAGISRAIRYFRAKTSRETPAGTAAINSTVCFLGPNSL